MDKTSKADFNFFESLEKWEKMRDIEVRESERVRESEGERES